MKLQHVAWSLFGASAMYVALALHAGPEADPVPNAAAEESGTRLKAKFTLGSDGSKIYDSEIMHDSVLGVDCSFRKAADGEFRCLPLDRVASFDGWTNIRFEDDQCTTPFVILPATGVDCDENPFPYMLHVVLPADCASDPSGMRWRVFEVGAIIPASGVHYTWNGNGDCGATVHPIDNPTYLDLVEVSPSEFVLGTANVAP